MNTKTEYEIMENGTNTPWHKLNKRAQEIAHEAMEMAISDANPRAKLTRLLDSDHEFREAIDCLDYDIYPQEVDTVARYFKNHYLLTTRQ